MIGGLRQRQEQHAVEGDHGRGSLRLNRNVTPSFCNVDRKCGGGGPNGAAFFTAGATALSNTSLPRALSRRRR